MKNKNDKSLIDITEFMDKYYKCPVFCTESMEKLILKYNGK